MTHEEIAKKITGMAHKKAWLVARLARDDRRCLAEDLAQEGWVAWLKHPEKTDDERLIKARDAMSLYWRRWRWQKHSQIYNGEHSAKTRPDMDFVDLHEPAVLNSPMLIDDSPSVEENAYGCEIMRKLEEFFATRKYPERFEARLFDAVAHGLDSKGRNAAVQQYSRASRSRCLSEIRQYFRSEFIEHAEAI